LTQFANRGEAVKREFGVSEYLAVNEIVVSFLRSGSNFWLLSPNNRNSNGNINGFNVNSNGNLNNNNVSNANGVRPAFKSHPLVTED